jgi:hypothetical protein
LLARWRELRIRQVTDGTGRFWQRAWRFAADIVSRLAPYRARQYSGHGTFKDGGWLSCEPRYVVSFPPIRLDTSAEYAYVLRNLPPVDYSVTFDIEPYLIRKEASR